MSTKQADPAGDTPTVGEDARSASRRTRRSVSLRRKLLYVFVTTAVALVACEVVLRLLWHNSYANQSPDYYQKVRIQTPNRAFLIDRSGYRPDDPHVWVRTNERSYILPAFQHEDAVATVAFLGGSTTACETVPRDLRFPAYVSELFLAEKGLRVNTLNAGRPANTLQDTVNILFNHVVYDRPDIAVVMHASNDSRLLITKDGYQLRSAKPLAFKDCWKWVKHTATSRVYLFALVRTYFRNVTSQAGPGDAARWQVDPQRAGKIPVEAFRKRLATYADICRNFGIQPVLMTQPFTGTTNKLTPDWADLSAQDRMNETIRAYGEDAGVPVIDLARYLKEEVAGWKDDNNLFYDGLHVTEKGSQVYARYIVRELEPLVRAAAAGRRSAEGEVVRE